MWMVPSTVPSIYHALAPIVPTMGGVDTRTSRARDPGAAALLIRRGANVDLADKDGTTGCIKRWLGEGSDEGSLGTRMPGVLWFAAAAWWSGMAQSIERGSWALTSTRMTVFSV